MDESKEPSTTSSTTSVVEEEPSLKKVKTTMNDPTTTNNNNNNNNNETILHNNNDDDDEYKEAPDEEWPEAWLMKDDIMDQKQSNKQEPNVVITADELRQLGIRFVFFFVFCLLITYLLFE